MSILKKLQQRWKLKSFGQVLVVLMVFALTGFTVLFLKKPVIKFFTADGEPGIWFSVAYYILILPVYNVILLFYGLLFGQFDFFWAFEKKSFQRIFGKKSKKAESNESKSI